VQELFAAYAAGGVTLHGLAARLSARQVPTPTGKPIWRPTTIRGLLTNPAYKGQAASGRLRTAPARRRKSALEPIGKGQSTTAHPPEEWITVPVPALVAAEQFDLVQQRLAANQRSARRSTTHPYLLRGWSAAGSAAWPVLGPPAPPATPGIATTAARASRRGWPPAAHAAARRGSSPPRSSTSWSGRTCARSLRSPSWSPRPWSAPTAAPGCPRSRCRRQATLRSVRASVARQRQRLLEAYLAEVIDLDTFQRQDRILAGQQADPLARQREVAARVSGWSRSAASPSP
jgi:hypothetical protein